MTSPQPLPFAGRARDEATVSVVNLAGPRRAVVSTVVPFPDGAYHGEPLGVDGTAAQVHRFGATWPDGSWRHARVFMPAADFPDQGRTVLRLERGSVGAPAFDWHPDILARVPEMRLTLDERDAGSGEFTTWEPIESGHLARTAVARTRIAGTPFWGELTLRFYSGLGFAHFWLHYGASDPSDPEPAWVRDAVTLTVAGAGLATYHPGRLLGETSPAPATTAVLLDGGGQWSDGQSQMLAGVLILGGDADTAVAEVMMPLLAVATNWPESGAFGPWGFLPFPHVDLDDETASQAAAEGYRLWENREPWEPCLHGCNPKPGDTGDQSDFGASVMHPEAWGYPHRLYSIQRSVYQEACRPTHRRELDGRPVQFSAYPGALLWDSVVHHGLSTERFGKSRGISAYETRTDPRGRHWWGHDRQHFSTNYLTTYAMLTGDPLAVAECEHKAEVWLGMMRLDSGSPVLDGMGAARAVGRTLHAGTSLYLVTGRQDLAGRIRGRIQVTWEQWAGKLTRPTRPLDVNQPDPRKLGGVVPFWMPWQEGIGVRGLDAVHRVFGDLHARDLVHDVATNLMRFGLWKMPNGSWTCGDAVRWLGGEDPTELLDREEYQPFLLWVAPAVIIGRRDAQQSGDVDLVRQADEILAQLRASPSWRVLEWLAVE